MVFADIKNDFVFRRIFAGHPEILRSFLNDLLDRQGDRTIESLEYLPSEQFPLVAGAKLSILDVRCRERSGAVFVVEMQLLHVAGFVNRVVFNACKAYVGQLKAGEPYTTLANVVAISICDFTLWPDADQDAASLPRVPMISRWNMAERGSGNQGLLQVQYAFLELPKLSTQGSDATGAALWAWLFVHAAELTAVPDDLRPGPHRAALELANEATFTQSELDAYRKVMDEIQQAREYGDAKRAEGEAEGLAKGKAQGEAEGLAKGKAQGLANAIILVLEGRGLAVSQEARRLIVNQGDIIRLEGWLRAVGTIPSVAALLAT